MIKRLLIIYIILTSLELYNISVLGESIVKMAQITGIGLLLLIILLQSVYNQERGFKLNFKWEITAIFISLLLSVLMAYSGHGQSFSITIIAQRFMYFYLFYFALHQIRIPNTDLEKIMLYLAAVHALFYIIQFLAYPTILFNVRVSSDRGTIRIFLQGMTYMMLAYFFILQKLYTNFRLSRLLFLLFLFSIFILMGTRQLIFTMFMLTMINVLMSKTVKSKLLIFTLVVLATIPVFFMFQNIFLNMLMVSETQSAGFEEDIRIRSATYFLTDFFPNRLAYITGNGVDSANSGFGSMIQMYKDVYGYFQTDIGIIGDFSRYGVFFLIAVLSIIIRVLSSKIPEHLSYIKYLFITILLTFFTGGGAFGQGSSIVAICTTLYLIDIHRHDASITDEIGEDDEEDKPRTGKETVEMINN